MKTKKLIGLIGAGLASMAMLTGASKAPAYNNAPQAAKEIKATTNGPSRVRSKIVQEVGGIPLETYGSGYGMSPKEYGMRFGHGNKKKHTNLLRSSHNAKLKRRK